MKWIEVSTNVINAELDDLGVDQEVTPIDTLVRVDHIVSVRKEAEGFGPGLAALDMINGNQYACNNTYDEIIELIRNAKDI